MHSIATEIIFGGSRGKTRRSEIWFYLIRVPKALAQHIICVLRLFQDDSVSGEPSV
ncbi:MAG: hypothetical protein ACJA0J_002252 [Bdellovibrionota bacterium]